MTDHKQDIINIIGQLTTDAKNILKEDIDISSGNIIRLTVYVMELVEKIKEPLTSEEKLYIATSVLENTIDGIHQLSNKDKADIKQLIPNTIEIIINASKGKFSFGKKKRVNKVKVNTIKITNQIYDRLLVLIKEKDIDSKTLGINIFILLTQIMSIVDEYPDITGTEKRNIVINVFNRLIDELDTIFPDITEDDKALIIMAIKYIIPLIETLIDVIRKKVDINKVKNWFSRTFEKCKCSCKK